MQTKTNNTTLKFEYGGGDTEHILVVRGRPFSILQSSNLPTPTNTYIDFKLVRELGLKVTNMTYEKMTYCGKKMRKIGNIAVTAQCLVDGRALGSVALKATVVLGLSEYIEADAVAGHKLLYILGSSSGSSPSPGPQSPRASPPRTPTPPPGRPSPPPSYKGSPTTPVAPSPTSSPPGRPRPTPPSSPPGFPIPARYTTVYSSLHDQPVTLSPLSTNISAFSQSFGHANDQPSPEAELDYLKKKVDVEGIIAMTSSMTDKVFVFSDKTDHYVYETGHGPNKCFAKRCMKEEEPENVPVNCGHHQDWIMPRDYNPCGDNCQMAFCSCIKEYPMNQFCDFYDFDIETGQVMMMKEML